MLPEAIRRRPIVRAIRPTLAMRRGSEARGTEPDDAQVRPDPLSLVVRGRGEDRVQVQGLGVRGVQAEGRRRGGPLMEVKADDVKLLK
jgi:hypothetical protein